MIALGAVGLAGFALHAAFHVRRGRASEVLWACHVGALLAAIGAITASRWLVAMGACLLSYGVPLWLADVVTGGELLVTSLGTHLVGPIVAGLALRELGWPPGAWAAAWLGSLALLALSRAVTAPEANVNLVFRVAAGWERRFRRHGLYVAGLWLASGAVYFVVERAARHLLAR